MDLYDAFRKHGLPKLEGPSEVSQANLVIPKITSKQSLHVATQFLAKPFCDALWRLQHLGPVMATWIASVGPIIGILQRYYRFGSRPPQ